MLQLLGGVGPVKRQGLKGTESRDQGPTQDRTAAKVTAEDATRDQVKNQPISLRSTAFKFKWGTRVQRWSNEFILWL